MFIRPGVYRLGETVEIYGNFTFYDGSKDASDVLLMIRKPAPDNTILGPFPLSVVDGEAFMDFDPDMVGTWKVRLECRFPKVAVTESKFQVVPPIL